MLVRDKFSFQLFPKRTGGSITICFISAMISLQFAIVKLTAERAFWMSSNRVIFKICLWRWTSLVFICDILFFRMLRYLALGLWGFVAILMRAFFPGLNGRLRPLLILLWKSDWYFVLEYMLINETSIQCNVWTYLLLLDQFNRLWKNDPKESPRLEAKM